MHMSKGRFQLSVELALVGCHVSMILNYFHHHRSGRRQRERFRPGSPLLRRTAVLIQRKLAVAATRKEVHLATYTTLQSDSFTSLTVKRFWSGHLTKTIGMLDHLLLKKEALVGKTYRCLVSMVTLLMLSFCVGCFARIFVGLTLALFHKSERKSLGPLAEAWALKV